MLPGVLQGLRLPRSLRMYRYTGMQRDEPGASVFAYKRILRVNTGADVRIRGCDRLSACRGRPAYMHESARL